MASFRGPSVGFAARIHKWKRQSAATLQHDDSMDDASRDSDIPTHVASTDQVSSGKGGLDEWQHAEMEALSIASVPSPALVST